MPLLEFVKSNQNNVQELGIQQIVAIAGTGELKDNSECSRELREYLSITPTSRLQNYIEECLGSSFTNSGLVLQEIVNELGKRLEYNVENGLFSGRRNQIGYDGIWKEKSGTSIIVEVKTTDAYRISLDRIAQYRNSLIQNGQIESDSSSLIVVGRQDTGDLESQIRGSRHAWSMRVISAEALMKLVLLKEDTEEEETLNKIRSILTPFEYTRLDNLIDVLFTATQDVESSAKNEIESPESSNEVNENSGNRWDFTPQEIIQSKRLSIISSFEQQFGTPLLKKSKALYWNKDKNYRVACTISKRYERGGQKYWYAFHPRWNDFLLEAEFSYFILGCVDLDQGFAIPIEVVREQLDYLNITKKDEKNYYWHIQLEEKSEEMFWLIPKKSTNISISKYAIDLPK